MSKIRIVSMLVVVLFGAGSLSAQNTCGFPSAPTFGFGSGPTVSFGSMLVGPDGTLYVLIPDSTSGNNQPAGTEIVALNTAASPAVTWKMHLTGSIGPVLAGASSLYVFQTVTSGSGATATHTSAILWLSAATGAEVRSTPASGYENIQVKTVNGKDLLYVDTVQTTTTVSGSTRTTTTTHTVTIYGPDGAVIKTATL